MKMSTGVLEYQVFLLQLQQSAQLIMITNEIVEIIVEQTNLYLQKNVAGKKFKKP